MLINEAQILQDWNSTIAPAKIEDTYKVKWLSRMLENMLVNQVGTNGINEASIVNPYSTQTNTLGIGGINPAPAPSGLNAFFNGGSGSPDRYPNVFALSVQIAQKTIGFDLVNVIPMSTPAGQVAYAEFYYADGDVNTVNRPSLIKIDAPGTYTSGTAYYATNNNTLTVATGDKFLQLFFAGNSAIDGLPIFEVGQVALEATVGVGPVTTFAATTNLKVADVFDGTGRIIGAVPNGSTPDVTGATSVAASTGVVTALASLVAAIEDHIQGYTGSGRSDTDRYSGNFLDRGTRLTTGMSRGVAEKTYPKNMSIEVHTKFIDTVERQLTASLTRQQIFDLQKVQGIEAAPMMENLLADQLSQSISKEITELAFAMGWTSAKAVEVSQNGFSLNVTLDPALNTSTTVTYVGQDGSQLTCNVPAFVSYGGLENLQSMQRRISSKVLMASNVITQRNRGRGGATFIVTNMQLATAMQDASQYNLAAMNNNLSQNSGSLFAIGTLAGMTIYVDPYMSANDNRILVGRRGQDVEPGIKFMPYAMAESVSIIPEGTMGYKTLLSSRYALVPLGINPEVNYMTIFVRLGNNVII